LFTDVDGTPVAQVNSTTGAVAHRYTDPFGNQVGAAPTGWADDHGFLNKVQDADTGLTLVGARQYDTGLGRFITVDPVLAPTNPQQNNGYAYAGNDPVTSSDPTGLEPAARQCMGKRVDMVACVDYFYGGGWNDPAPKPNKDQQGAYLDSLTGVPSDLNVAAAEACGWNGSCVNTQPDRYQAGQAYHPAPNSLGSGCHGADDCVFKLATVAFTVCMITCGLIGTGASGDLDALTGWGRALSKLPRAARLSEKPPNFDPET
jgi:RHS repeat-associated protein